MSSSGNCYDNAAVESFFGLLKRERVNRVRYRTRDEARADVFDYIEVFYNRIRRRGVLLQSFARHPNTNVRFLADYDCFTPISGRSGPHWFSAVFDP